MDDPGTQAMLPSRTLARATRSWILVAVVGAAGFAVGTVTFLVLGPDLVVAALTATSAPIAAAVAALPFALGAAAVAGLIANSRRRAQSRLLRTALNNMSQALCMFDRSGRLVLCNRRYVEMYQLQPEHARPGTPLRDLLTYRMSVGTFSGDPDAYVESCLRVAAQGATETRNLTTSDGRIIAMINRPLPRGGWLATHTDLTEQVTAERERDSLRLRDERRQATDALVASFRMRVENVLNTVSERAAAGKAAAQALLTTSDHTLQRASGAARGSSEASINVEAAAAAATELSASIKEISRQLVHTNEVVSGAAADTRTTNDNIAALAQDIPEKQCALP